MGGLGCPPTQTIFEINASSHDLSSQVMRRQAGEGHKAIASFRQGPRSNRRARRAPSPRPPSTLGGQPEGGGGRECRGAEPLPGDPGVWPGGGGKAGQVPAARGADLRALSHY